MIGIAFGDYLMVDPTNGRQVSSTDIYSSPRNRIQAETLADADGAIIVKQQFEPKTFSVEGMIMADSVESIELAMDEFKRAMAVKNQAFDIDYAGSTRRYLANAENVIINRQTTLFSYSVEFLSPDGMGWSLDLSELVSAPNITSSTSDISLDAEGTYQVEPLLTVTMNSLTGGTAKTVTISNGSTLRGLSVTRNWAAGDVMEVDSLRKTVFLNNAPVIFSGQFPKWDIGSGVMTYLDDLTTRDVTISATYTRRWL